MVIPEDVIISIAQSSVLAFRSANMQPPNLVPQAHCTHHVSSPSWIPKWIKPTNNRLKANSDANLQNWGMWGLGVIIRNEDGMAMAAATWLSKGFHCALTAEAIVLLNTVKLARDCGFRHVEFESDNEKLVNLLKHKEHANRLYVGLVVKEIILLLSQFDFCVFRHTHRLGNKVVHSLAQLAHSEPNRV